MATPSVFVTRVAQLVCELMFVRPAAPETELRLPHFRQQLRRPLLQNRA